MTDPVSLTLLMIGGIFASILSSVAGFGGAAILLPITVAVFGVHDAIPILTIAQLIGNGSRVWFNRRSISYPVVFWFAFGCIPASVTGGLLFALTPIPILLQFLGILLILIVVWRHLTATGAWTMPLWGFAPLGAVQGFLSAMLGSVGPLVAPFFLSYGLIKGAYIGTEASAAVIIHATKFITYTGMSLVTTSNVVIGLMFGPVMILGSFIGKPIVDQIPERVFVFMIELTLFAAGVRFLVSN